MAIRAARRPTIRVPNNFKENLAAYLFLTPWLIGLIGLTLGPMLSSFYLSFTRFELLTPPDWVGFNNYVVLLTKDQRFLNSLRVTFTYVLLGVPLKLAFALMVAMVLNLKIKGVNFFRSLYYLPSILGGSVAIAILWRKIFGIDGLVNQCLAVFGITGRSWIGLPDTALYTLILLTIWQFGSSMVIFLAGLKQIPREIYEASEIDGAGKISQFFRITLPLITPLIFFNLVMQMISAFQAYTPAFIISGGSGGPSDSTMFYSLLLYIRGFQDFKMGYAAAMAWVLLLIISFFTAIAFSSSRFWVFYEDQR